MKRSFSLILIALLIFCVGSEQSSGQNRGRLLRIPDSTLFLGQAASLPIEFYGQGGEREVSFSVQVPPLLRYVNVESGTSPTDLETTVDTRFINFGYLGIRVTSDQGLPAGRTLLARVIVYSDVPSPHLSFANIPNPTVVRDDSGSSLPVSTSAGVSLGWGIADPSLYIRAASVNSDPGQDVEIPISFIPWFGISGMNSAQFSLFWDPAIFDYETAEIGPVVPPATSLQLDTSMTAAGKLGVVLNTSSEYLNTINYRVLSLSLRTRPDAPFGSYAIGFGDRPIVTRFRSPTQAFDFSYLWIPGFVQVGTPPPPTVGVGGRILTASNYAVQNTRVTLTNERGDVFVALTNFQGRFSFPNMFHGVYQMRFESKRYRIPNRTITVPNGTGNMAIEAFE